MTRPASGLVRAMAGLGALALAGCSAGSSGAPAAQGDEASSEASSLTVVMTDAGHGVAVWPSGRDWLVLRTGDGWQHITNVTPRAVPTGGGIAVSVSGSRLTAVILPVEQMTISPYLTSVDAGDHWTPGQLPGGAVRSTGAVAATSSRTAALVGSGRLVAGGPDVWTTLASESSLAAGGRLHLDSVTWASPQRGWLTGTAPAGTPVAYQTDDAGRTWTAVAGAQASTGSAAALPPCGSGSSWLLPVLVGGAGGSVVVQASTDGGATWVPVATLGSPATGRAWGCHGPDAWLVLRTPGGPHLMRSTDGGRTWSDRGPAPERVSALAPAGGGQGFAAGLVGSSAVLWRVDAATGRFTEVPLPAWVAQSGGQSMQH